MPSPRANPPPRDSQAEFWYTEVRLDIDVLDSSRVGDVQIELFYARVYENWI
ncbi:hypothetical protein EUX98_g7360 [Antrodiella citrinella]|uniref:Uncharacterized protein n=1 Tax=Antrodiella citrinella TaxID=2447956 RepID=A0A4S4MNF0_9APHY|nr:hypothetical protein EUX98_g7360 [Antrodiella citrinella]